VYLGARVSSRAPAGFVRRALALVLLASGLKLLGVSNAALGWTLLAVLLLGPPLWAWVRVNHGLPPLARPEMKQRRRPNQSDEETETGRRVR